MNWLFLVLYGAGILALVYALARCGVSFEPRLIARFPLLHRSWVLFAVWMAATVALVALGGISSQLDGVVLKASGSVLWMSALVAGCWLSVRGFTRHWAAFVLPAVLLVYVWLGSVYSYIAYEEGWVEQTGDSGNLAFVGAYLLTPMILILGIPAGWFAGRDNVGANGIRPTTPRTT